MKKLIIFLLLSFLSLNVSAQVQDTRPWCPAGATWIYRKTSQAEVWFSVFKYIDDEIISNKLTKKISLTDVVVGINGLTGEKYRGSHFKGYINVYNSNDSIYIYFENSFHFVYSFSAISGDYFIVNNFQNFYQCPQLVNQDDSIFVENTAIENFDGINFDVILTPLNSNSYWGLGRKIIKNIGADGGFWPGNNEIDDCAFEIGNLNLTCYYDDLRGDIYFSSFAYPDFPCSYVASTSEKNKNEKFTFDIYPNPCKEILTVPNLEGKPFDFDIFDINGRKLLGGKDFKDNSINVSKLNSGSYFIKITRDNFFSTSKFIKE